VKVTVAPDAVYVIVMMPFAIANTVSPSFNPSVTAGYNSAARYRFPNPHPVENGAELSTTAQSIDKLASLNRPAPIQTCQRRLAQIPELIPSRR
jgi:hypothetical protein